MGLKKEAEKSLSIKQRETNLRKETEPPIRRSQDTKSNGTKRNTRRPPNQIVKQGKKYKEELERSDDGVKVGSQLLEKGFKTSKVTVKGVKTANKKLSQRRQNTKIRKAQEKQINNLKEKLNETHIKSDIQKTSKNNTFIRKVMRQPKNLSKKGAESAVLKGASTYKESLTKDDDGVKVGVEGTKKTGQLVKKGAKTLYHVTRKRKKGNEKSTKKLREFNTKLRTNNSIRTANATKGIRTNQRRILRKRITGRNIQQAQKTRTLRTINKNLSRSLKLGLNNARRLIIAQLKRLTGVKILAGAGAVVVKLLPVILVIGIFFGIAFIFMGAGGNEANNQSFGGIKTLSPQVEQWRSLVTEIAEEKNMTDYIDLVLAIIEVETGGVGTRDIMQSSESAGYPPNYFQTERESIEQGISYLKSITNLLKGYNENYLNDYKLISQSYNFGIGFATYTYAQEAQGYDLDLAETYSRDVVAWSLGNTTGETYPYENDLSIRLGKPYLYRNGGNFLYGELIGQYVISYGDGQIAPPVTPLIVTSHFGNRSSPGGIGSTNHKGIDLACQGGVTPINSLFAGEVITSAYLGGLGNTVVVKHSNDLYTTYGHMSRLIAEVGQSVNAGDTLGICGSTGNSTGPHLHLEISPEPHNYQVDPYPYIQQFEGR